MRNRIREYGAKYLGEGIARCVPLTSLNINLEGNSIGGNGNRILEQLVIKSKRLIKYLIMPN